MIKYLGRVWMVETPENNQSAMLSRTEPIPNSSTVPPEWSIDNLCVTHFRNGDPIHVT